MSATGGPGAAGRGTIPLTIGQLIAVRAEETPDAPALLAPERDPLTYRRLSEQVETVGRRLRSLGIGPDDRVAIVHPNGPELAALFLSVASAATCAPLNPTYRLSELDFYLADLHAKAIALPAGLETPLRLLAQRRGIRVLPVEPVLSEGAGAFSIPAGRRARLGERSPDDVALVLHTSGTTARPKIVPLSHRQLVLSARNVAATLELEPDDRCLNVMPLFHIHGLVGALLSSLAAGAAVVCTPGFHAPSFRRWLDGLRPTWYSAVPTMHQAVLERVAGDVSVRDSTLRLIRSSSSPLPPRVSEALEDTFRVPVIEAYGMTEAAHQMTSNPLPPLPRKPGSVGPASHLEVTVLGTEAVELAAGEVGEVAIRGETVFSGYEANPEANESAFVDGWFRTGDEGSLDEDGYLFLKGRSKEIINRAGEKVSPAEVEDALLGHPDVVQAASFAVPHTRLGEDVGAAVVAREGSLVTERDLQAHVSARLADFKVPSTVVLVDDIPKGPTGKLQRIGLAERLGIVEAPGPAAPVEYAPPRSDLEREMGELWAATLEVDRVGIEDDFFSLGGDSILGAELVARIAERLGRRVPLTTLMWAPTLGSFTALVEDESWDEDALIVPVQTGGSRSPLFVTHGLGDEILNVAVLKRTLGPDQPLYAIRAPIERFDYPSVEIMADEYYREIRALQPSGPYLFASMCSGTAIVMELARRVWAADERVDLAAVIDPLGRWGRRGARYYASRLVEHARDRRLIWATGRKLRHWRSHVLPEKYPDPELDVDPLSPIMGSLRRRYALRRIPGTFTVLSTMDYDVPRSFWERYADRVAWYEMPTPHHTVFQYPHADVLGETLGQALRDATEAGTGAS